MSLLRPIVPWPLFSRSSPSCPAPLSPEPLSDAEFKPGRLLASLLIALVIAPDLLAPARASTGHSCPKPPEASWLEPELIALVNVARQRHGLRPVRARAELAAAATRQACDLARTQRLDHVGSDGSTLRQRMRDAGYRPRTGNENIAIGFSSAQIAVESWMRSPGHRANFLDPDVTEIGVAVASARRLGWATVMGRPK